MQSKNQSFWFHFRAEVTSAEPKLRISERNAKQKPKFLVSFPNESNFSEQKALGKGQNGKKGKGMFCKTISFL